MLKTRLAYITVAFVAGTASIALGAGACRPQTSIVISQSPLGIVSGGLEGPACAAQDRTGVLAQIAEVGYIAKVLVSLVVGVILIVVLVVIASGQRDGERGSINRYMVPHVVEHAVQIIEPGCVITDLKVDPMGRFELRSEGRGGPSRIRAYRQEVLTIAATAPEGAYG